MSTRETEARLGNAGEGAQTQPGIGDYPYGSAPLSADWSSPHSRRLAALSVIAALVAIGLQLPLQLAAVDDIALRIAFPALLAFVLAFAPRPRTRVGRIARDLTVCGLCLSVFAGNAVPVMLALYPLVLVAAVVIGESRLGATLWGADR